MPKYLISDLQLQQLMESSVGRIQRLPQKYNKGCNPQGVHLSQLSNLQESSVNETLKFKGETASVSEIKIIELPVPFVISREIPSGHQLGLLPCLFPSLVWVKYINLRRTCRASVCICWLLQFLVAGNQEQLYHFWTTASNSLACYGNPMKQQPNALNFGITFF